jgi:thiol:disulfide interchange protein DsbD
VLGTFFGLGLLLGFTPCVLPMVPILSGIIVGQGASITTGRAFALSLDYVLGMALTYTVAGRRVCRLRPWPAGAGRISAALDHWCCSRCADCARLSMFGLFTLQMPAAMQTRLSR